MPPPVSTRSRLHPLHSHSHSSPLSPLMLGIDPPSHSTFNASAWGTLSGPCDCALDGGPRASLLSTWKGTDAIAACPRRAEGTAATPLDGCGVTVRHAAMYPVDHASSGAPHHPLNSPRLFAGALKLCVKASVAT